MDWIVCKIVPLTVWMAYVTTSTGIVIVHMERRDLLTAMKVVPRVLMEWTVVTIAARVVKTDLVIQGMETALLGVNLLMKDQSVTKKIKQR